MTVSRSQPITGHTPTPWQYVPWHIEEGPPAVRAPAGHIVATTASDTDAAFIVEAVNSHAALKARIAELESNDAAYESILGPRTYNELAEHIKYLEARVAILDFCCTRVDCLVRGEAMKQKDGS